MTPTPSPIVAVVLAAGRGTRMKSSLPKVLHRAAGRPILAYPVLAARELGASRVIVVVSPNTRSAIEAELREALPEVELAYAVQEVARGTGDALKAALPLVTQGGEGRVLVLYGDTPLLEARHLEPLVASSEAKLAFLSFELEQPHGYGRVVRGADGAPLRVVEERDIREDGIRAIREVNAGVYCGDVRAVMEAVGALKPLNEQGEYYLTDIVEAIASQGKVEAHLTEPGALLGVNQRAELAFVEARLFERIRRRWGELGVSITGAPLIDDQVELAPDVRVEDGARLRGKTRIQVGARVDVGVVIDDSLIEEGAEIKPYSVIVKSQVGPRAVIGPFAHLRPESHIEAEAHIGNFVETKKTRVRRGAKANHLAYLGDGDIGARANVGAGVIFCNYDGYRKQPTVIGEGAFIGSDSQLIAPVTIGKDAYVATGTTVTSDVPDDALAIGRARVSIKEGYATKLRQRLKRGKEQG